MIKGPYTREDWLTMRMLKDSIRYLEDRKRASLSLPIKEEKKKLKKYLERAA